MTLLPAVGPDVDGLCRADRLTGAMPWYAVCLLSTASVAVMLAFVVTRGRASRPARTTQEPVALAEVVSLDDARARRTALSSRAV